MFFGETGLRPFNWVPSDWRLPPELSFYGLYYTPTFIIIIAALVLGIISAWVLVRFNVSHYIWHPPLFILALIVIYGLLLSFAFLPK